MAANVPKFGSWEGGENYTAYFDNARKTKSTGPMINPNDPEQNPDMFPQNTPPRGIEPQGQESKTPPQFGAWEQGDGYTAYFETARKNKANRPPKVDKEPQLNRDMNLHSDPHEPQKPQVKRDVTQSDEHGQEGRAKVPRFGSWDGKDGVQYTAYFDNARKNRAEAVELELNRDVERARPTKVGSEENMGHGGMRSNYEQTRMKDDGQLGNVRGGSTSAGSEKQGTQTPGGRSPLHHPRGKPQAKPGGKGSQTPERGATIPPFGVWNKDPQAEGFTGPFIRAREDRMTPLNNATPARHNNQSNTNQESKKKCCCFSWF